MFSHSSPSTFAAIALRASSSFAFRANVGNPPGSADHPPVCNNNGPYVFEAANLPGTTTTTVTLSSAGSFDPDGDALSFFWFEECSSAFFSDPTLPNAVLTVDMGNQCTRVCTVELRVTANGKTTRCKTTVTVQDTTAPTFVDCPPDAYLIWNLHDATQGPSPVQTGFVVVSDNADPNPAVGFTDQFFTDPVGSGLENHIIRTWTATDSCGNSNFGCVQTIYLVSPKAGAGGPNFDLDIGACPNVIDRTSTLTMSATLLGTKNFDVANVDTSTLHAQRITDTTEQMSLASANFAFGDFGSNTAVSPTQCNSATTDGRADLGIGFDIATFVAALALDAESPGATVEIWLTGRTLTGKAFVIRDIATMN